MNKLRNTFIVFSIIITAFSCTNKKKPTTLETEKVTWKFVKLIALDTISPIGIASQDDFLWISDVDHNRVVKINHSGDIIKTVTGFTRPMHISINNSKIYIPEYTTDTLKVLQNENISVVPMLKKPDAIAGVSVENDRIAIADFYNNRIIIQQKNDITLIGKQGHKDGELYYPTDLQIKDSLIYVADAYNNRVQVFNLKGNYVRMIGWNDNIKVATGLKVTNTEIIIADFEGNRILIYDLYGKLIQILNTNFNQPTDIEIVKNTMFVVNYKGKSISVFSLK